MNREVYVQKLFPKKHWTNMPLKQVGGHILRDDRFIRFKRRKVPIPQLRRNFEADMQQLPEALVIRLVALFMTKRRGVLLAGPPIDLFRLGQLGRIDVDHGRVRRAKLFAVGVSLGIDLLGDLEAGSASLSQAN